MDLYRRPANRFVAGFLGSPRMNFLPARVASAGDQSLEVEVAGERVRVARQLAARAGDVVTLGVRPEDLSLAQSAESAIPNGVLRGEVSLLERLGGEAIVHVALRGPQSETLVAKLPGDVSLSPRQPVGLRLNGSTCHLFDQAGQAIA